MKKFASIAVLLLCAVFLIAAAPAADPAPAPIRTAKQIGILAELNQCSRERIKQILVAGGCELPGNMRPKKAPTAAAEPEPETEAAVAPMAAMPRRKSVTLVAFDLICELGDDGILDRSLPGIVALVRALREEGYE